MTRTRIALAFSVGALTSAAGLAACFPDYGIGGSDAGGGADSVTGPDVAGGDSGSVPDSTMGGDGMTGDSGSKGDSRAGDSASGDTATPFDSGTVGDGSLVVVSSGTYYFEVNEDAGAAFGDYDASVTLDYRFGIDKDEVTIARFAAWVDAGMPAPPDQQSLDPTGPYVAAMVWQSGFDPYVAAQYYTTFDGGVSSCGYSNTQPPLGTYTAANLASHPDYPMNCVTWAQALAFCWWEGAKRLPTDSEWRVVATSGGTRMPYPWGATPDMNFPCSYVTADFGTPFCNFPVAVESANLGSTANGVYDIVGSLAEWLWDPQPNQYYWYPPNAGTDYTFDASSAGPTTNRVYIGGDWSSAVNPEVMSIQAGPDYGSSTEGFDNCGFRCAQTLP